MSGTTNKHLLNKQTEFTDNRTTKNTTRKQKSQQNSDRHGRQKTTFLPNNQLPNSN